MRIEGGKLVLERGECHQCWGAGTVPTQIPCPACNGTRRGPRGGRNRCGCYDGTVWDQENRVTCPGCNGHPEGAREETRYDSLPQGSLAAIPLYLVRQNRDISWNESYIGMGTIHSLSDYGRAWGMTDGEVLDKVHAELETEWVQGCKISDESCNVCSALLVTLHRGGYSIWPVFGDLQEVADDTARQLDVETGFAVGIRLAGAGLPGSILAAKYRRS